MRSQVPPVRPTGGLHNISGSGICKVCRGKQLGDALGEEGLIGLGRDNAADSALRSAVGGHDRHSGAQLAAPGVRAWGPEQAVHAAGQLGSGVVLEQEEEAAAALVCACTQHTARHCHDIILQACSTRSCTWAFVPMSVMHAGVSKRFATNAAIP